MGVACTFDPETRVPLVCVHFLVQCTVATLDITTPTVLSAKERRRRFGHRCPLIWLKGWCTSIDCRPHPRHGCSAACPAGCAALLRASGETSQKGLRWLHLGTRCRHPHDQSQSYVRNTAHQEEVKWEPLCFESHHTTPHQTPHNPTTLHHTTAHHATYTTQHNRTQQKATPSHATSHHAMPHHMTPYTPQRIAPLPLPHTHAHVCPCVQQEKLASLLFTGLTVLPVCVCHHTCPGEMAYEQPLPAKGTANLYNGLSEVDTK